VLLVKFKKLRLWLLEHGWGLAWRGYSCYENFDMPPECPRAWKGGNRRISRGPRGKRSYRRGFPGRLGAVTKLPLRASGVVNQQRIQWGARTGEIPVRLITETEKILFDANKIEIW
jgi:hypothetical protein